MSLVKKYLTVYVEIKYICNLKVYAKYLKTGARGHVFSLTSFASSDVI